VDDDDEEEGAAIPAGTPFYMTPAGYADIQEELRALWYDERTKVVEIVSWAAALGDRSENADYQYGKRRLREIDRRVRFLRKRVDNAQVVDPAAQTKRDRIFFGATVTYTRPDDSETTVTIVGSEEGDADHGKISWLAPIARALLGKGVGDMARVQLPTGPEELEILAIHYP
jgi:transcription elongation factor GreB